MSKTLDLYYYHSSHGNFGDDLNTWIWDALLPGWQTESALRRFLDRPGQLSDRAVLAAAQTRYRAVLADLRAEMAQG